MKFTTPLVAAALAATASAQAQASSNSLNSVSVLEVLATALPKSLLNLAITNSAAASSLISSEFAAGETPAWFSHLPHDIQTYLVPVTNAASPTSAPVPSIKPMNATGNMTTPTTPVTTKKVTSHAPGGPITTKMTTTVGAPGGGSTPSGPASPAGAGMIGVPTAGLFGAGVVGVAGLVGMLAL